MKLMYNVEVMSVWFTSETNHLIFMVKPIGPCFQLLALNVTKIFM